MILFTLFGSVGGDDRAALYSALVCAALALGWGLKKSGRPGPLLRHCRRLQVRRRRHVKASSQSLTSTTFHGGEYYAVTVAPAEPCL